MPTPNTYDELPYPAYIFPQTHPNRIAAIARFFGINTPSPSNSRVLELGCGQGGNLIAMAGYLPDAQFVGVDLSEKQIESGREYLTDVGLKNIDLHCQDISLIDKSWGEFDYIIAHGLYSWVPPDVQVKILGICKNNLSENGVAYVSYNCYPGWHIRDLTRAIMLQHTKKIVGAQQKVQQARAIIDFMATSAASDTNYAEILKDQATQLRKMEDSYLFHEYLEPHNQPLYFHQFIENTDAAGLKYLGEANISMMFDQVFPPEIKDSLRQLGDENIVQSEQYMDFARGRSFRQTLLVHPDHDLQRSPDWNAIKALNVSAQMSCSNPTASPDDSVDVEFVSSTGNKLTASAPLIKSALLCLLNAWPQSLPFEALVLHARRGLRGCANEVSARQEDMVALGNYLVHAFIFQVVELTVEPWGGQREISAAPISAPFARQQIRRAQPISNLRHAPIQPDLFTQRIIQLMTGQNNHAAIIEALVSQALAGEFQISRDGNPVMEKQELTELITRDFPGYLDRIRKFSLLAG